MDNLEPKKLALIRILQIFEKYSDCDHPLTQEDIARRLEQEYGINIAVSYTHLWPRRGFAARPGPALRPGI